MQPSTNCSPTISSLYSLPGLLWANMSAQGHGTAGNPSPILLGWFIASNNIPFPPHPAVRSGLISVLSTLFWDLLTYQLGQERKNISVTKWRAESCHWEDLLLLLFLSHLCTATVSSKGRHMARKGRQRRSEYWQLPGSLHNPTKRTPKMSKSFQAHRHSVNVALPETALVLLHSRMT